MQATRRAILPIKLAIVVLFLTGAAKAQQIKNAIPDVARPLPLSAVHLTGGPLKHAQDLDVELGMINWLSRWFRQDGALAEEQVAQQIAKITLHGLLGPKRSATHRGLQVVKD